MDDYDLAADILRPAKRVAVLTGAGVSADSGVPTFRASDGLWEGHRIEDVATPDGFGRNPELVWEFYNQRRVNVAAVKPNSGHLALADLERHFTGLDGGGFTLATQNVDGLHQTAGSVNVLELHGCLRQTRCLGCGVVTERGLEHLGARPLCPACGERLRPNIVWFHEMLPDGVLEAAGEAAAGCDVFLVVGTSAVVFPAAGLIPIARRAGAKVIEFNLTATDASHYADVTLVGRSAATLPQVTRRLGLGA
jgi:NAD-dependent deacetylase